MEGDSKTAITAILNDTHLDADERVRRILPLVYDELLAIARGRMAGERANHTLEPTALVNEAYLRLVPEPERGWAGKAHFFAAAAEAMRRILIDHARGKKRLKRGGRRIRLDLDAAVPIENDTEKSSLDFVALDEAICRLGDKDPRAAQVVRLRYYAGLTNAEAAEVLGVSERTVKNDWTFARSWLAKELE